MLLRKKEGPSTANGEKPIPSGAPLCSDVPVDFNEPKITTFFQREEDEIICLKIFTPDQKCAPWGGAQLGNEGTFTS